MTPLNKAIVRSGLPMKDIADRVGTDRTQMSRWVSGIRQPSPSQLAAIFSAISATPEEIRTTVEDLAHHHGPVYVTLVAAAEYIPLITGKALTDGEFAQIWRSASSKLV